MHAAGSSIGSCAMVTSQAPMGARILYCAPHGLRQRARCARAQLPAADPAHEEGARRAAIGPGAESGRHRSRRGEGLPGVLAPDRTPAPLAQRGAQGIHLLHEEEVTRIIAAAALLGAGAALAADATFSVKLLTPETAL